MAKVVLHVGCGPIGNDDLSVAFAESEWQELRLDINEAVRPDIVGNMTNMAAVADQSVDAIFSSHNIEHLYPHEVALAFAEFLRVLTPEGFAVITCPDLQYVAKLITDDKLLEPAYISPAGPIAPIDILYGLRQQLTIGNHFMAHHCGFTETVLTNTLLGCGFQSVISCRSLIIEPVWNLWAIATKSVTPETELRSLGKAHFPRQTPA